MKTTLNILLFLALAWNTANAQVGIGTTTPDAASILDVTATDKGFLPPRMSTADRNAISSPAEGLTIFNITVGCLQWYNGTGWFDACDGTTIGIPITSGACAGELSVFTFNGLEYSPIAYAGRCWLDRNLGASRVAQSSTDFEAYGHLYQWGRGNDGHQIINWVSATASDGAEQSNLSLSQSSLTNPGSTFITGFSNWYNGTNPNDLWKPDLTGVNNPCPAGYRVPSDTELIDLGITSAASAYSSIGLTMAGYRDLSAGGFLFEQSGSGYIWSSTVAGTLSRSLSFSSISASMVSDLRAYGVSVRCLKD